MKLIVLLGALVCAKTWAQDSPLINWFAGADLVGVANTQADLPTDFTVRELELSAYSNIDHTWQGTLTLALHKELGSEEEAHTEIHEAFIYSNQLLPKTNIKLGRFFLGFGRLNRFHRHDWALSYAPLYHEEFFGGETVKDDGLEVSHLLSSSFYLNLTVGITSGKQFKDEHHHHEEDDTEGGGSAHVPTHYLRLSSFKEFSTQKGLEYGVNYIGRRDQDGNAFNYAGVDLVFKNRFTKYYKDLFQMEIWQRSHREKGMGSYKNDMGAYGYYEKGLNQNHSLGLRVDWYRPHHGEEEEGEHEHGIEVDDDYGEVGIVYSYYNSEFMRIRATLAQSRGLVLDGREVDNTRFFLQTVFTIGAHPAHLY